MRNVLFIAAAIAVVMASGAAQAGGDYKPPAPPTNGGGPITINNHAEAVAAAAAYAKGGAGGGGGAGGAGGAGGVGQGGQGGIGQGGAGGNAQGGNSTGASVSNVGNTYNPNYPAASAYSMAYATFCINAQGIGAQAPWPLPGISFSITWMRDLCRWGHIAEMREKVGDMQGAEWARCQISEYAEADRHGTQQCPQNRAKQQVAAPVVTPAPAPMQFASRSDCVASLNATGQATPANVAACPR